MVSEHHMYASTKEIKYIQVGLKGTIFIPLN